MAGSEADFSGERPVSPDHPIRKGLFGLRPSRLAS